MCEADDSIEPMKYRRQAVNLLFDALRFNEGSLSTEQLCVIREVLENLGTLDVFTEDMARNIDHSLKDVGLDSIPGFEPEGKARTRQRAGVGKENNIIHSAEEFGKFPYDKLIFRDGHNSNWSWGYGGYGLPNGMLHIDIVWEDFSADIWVVPDAIAYMVKNSKKKAAEEVRSSIRAAIGVE